MNSHKPWLNRYDAGVPRTLDYPSISIPDLFFQKSILFSRCKFISAGERSYSYQESALLIQNIAQSLIKDGLTPGERVGVCLPNIPEFVFLFYGIMAAGGVVVALNPAYPEREMNYFLKAAEVTVLAGMASQKDSLERLGLTHPIRKIYLVGDTDKTTAKKLPVTQKRGGIEFIPFEELIKKNEASIDLPVLTTDLPAALQFSGGTTGTPKAAVVTHANLVANSMQFRVWLSSLEDGKEVFLAAIPLYHVYGMVIALNVAMIMGAEVILAKNPKNISELMDTIQRERVSFFPAVPTLFHAINHDPGVLTGKYNLHSIKACISGSAPLHSEIRQQFEALTGGKLVEGYGLTEAPTATHCNPILGENRTGSIGLPLPDVDCRIVQLENPLVETAAGEPGELLIRSPQVMKEYYCQPDETSAAIKDGWLHTGDIARMDNDGYFYIIGRIKELIKVNGLQVWPREVEEVLLQLPGVKEAVVAGIPDMAKGERVKAWIVLETGSDLEKKKIVDYCREMLVHYKVPSEIEFINEIPKTSVGKVLRRKLVELEK